MLSLSISAIQALVSAENFGIGVRLRVTFIEDIHFLCPRAAIACDEDEDNLSREFETDHSPYCSLLFATVRSEGCGAIAML